MERVDIQEVHLNKILHFKVVYEKRMVAKTGTHYISLGLAFRSTTGDSLNPLIFHKLFGSDNPGSRKMVELFNDSLDLNINVFWSGEDFINYTDNTYLGAEGYATLIEDEWNGVKSFKIKKMIKNIDRPEPLHASSSLPVSTISDEDLPF